MRPAHPFRIATLLLLPAVVFSAEDQLQIPDRPASSLFQGDQGKQKTEISFDPKSGVVTLKLVVQDAHGYFIPGIRRENFAVYEDNVRQTNATVAIEHAPVSLGLLMEYGGHQPGLNKQMVTEVSRAGRQLLDILGQEDKIAIWTYGDTVKQLTDFSQGGSKNGSLFLDLRPPDVSETNLYDALLFALNRMKPVAGRRAIVLVSSGIDTFSKSSYEDLLAALGGGNSPVYTVGLTHTMQSVALSQGSERAIAQVNWADAEHKLQEIARVSGGRFYSPDSTLDLSPVYDDIMENLKVRYVINYRSSGAATNTRHTVRIELIDPKTGQPLRIVAASGRPVLANAIVQESYVPR
jgi:Ca-activated chloride channel family protein